MYKCDLCLSIQSPRTKATVVQHEITCAGQKVMTQRVLCPVCVDGLQRNLPEATLKKMKGRARRISKRREPVLSVPVPVDPPRRKRTNGKSKLEERRVKAR